jgi:hypothetical protein
MRGIVDRARTVSGEVMVSAKALRWACAALLLVFMPGCAHEAQVAVSSKKLNAYHANIKRLLVLTDLGQVLKIQSGDEESAFEAAIMDSVGSCGIVANIHRHDPLALQNDEQATMKSFAPDTVMTLQWKTGQGYGGIVSSFHLIGTLVDVRTKTEVWRAEIDTAPGFYAGKNLAAQIIENLKRGSILDSSCVLPVVPQV